MKRNAGNELNHDNWDKEEEVEERGEFVAADSNVIAKRKVISARRKPTNTSSAGIFKSFTGFNQISSTPFNFDSKIKNDFPVISFESNKEKHLNAVKQLNQTFLENITKHINEDPICILTPLLDDYQSHLSSIKTKYPLSVSQTLDIKTKVVSKPEQPSFNFGSLKSNNETNSKESNMTFGSVFTETNPKESNANFGSVTTEKPFTFSSEKPFSLSSEKPVFGSFIGSSTTGTSSFNFLNKTIEPSTGSFFPTPSAVTSGSLFGSNTASAVTAETYAAAEEDYEPPTAEVREVKESDSAYDTKCKLYYQHDGEWKQRGVGNLFIKPHSKGKFQLVIRADNSLATIILNVFVNDLTPLSSVKNNVSLATITDFNKDNKPTPLLIRVKNEEKAQELLAAMKKQL